MFLNVFKLTHFAWMSGCGRILVCLSHNCRWHKNYLNNSIYIFSKTAIPTLWICGSGRKPFMGRQQGEAHCLSLTHFRKQSGAVIVFLILGTASDYVSAETDRLRIRTIWASVCVCIVLVGGRGKHSGYLFQLHCHFYLFSKAHISGTQSHFFFLLGLIFSPTSNLFIASAFIHLK